jgi:hypothetical protein
MVSAAMTRPSRRENPADPPIQRCFSDHFSLKSCQAQNLFILGSQPVFCDQGIYAAVFCLPSHRCQGKSFNLDDWTMSGAGAGAGRTNPNALSLVDWFWVACHVGLGYLDIQVRALAKDNHYLPRVRTTLTCSQTHPFHLRLGPGLPSPGNPPKPTVRQLFSFSLRLSGCLMRDQAPMRRRSGRR